MDYGILAERQRHKRTAEWNWGRGGYKSRNKTNCFDFAAEIN
jgi:hypothetical protein